MLTINTEKVGGFAKQFMVHLRATVGENLDKVYLLDVPFEEKDIGKLFKCVFVKNDEDGRKPCWSAPAGSDLWNYTRWMDSHELTMVDRPERQNGL